MNQEEKRLWLIRRLLAEDPQYKDVGIPEEAQRQRDLLRALMNVREAAPVDDAFLQVQNNGASGIYNLNLVLFGK